MVASRLAFGLAGLLLATTAVHAQFILPQDYRQQAPARVQYAPVDRALQPTTPYAPTAPAAPAPYAPSEARAPTQQPQSFYPQNFRTEKPIVQGETRTNWQEHRGQTERRAPVDTRSRPESRTLPDVRPLPEARGLADVRPPLDVRNAQEGRTSTPELRTQFLGNVPLGPPDLRDQVQLERRNNLGEIRTAPAPLVENRYLDYKVPERAPYDFRPYDYKPVDARTTDYKSQDNKAPDQKVLDPRLKEKGPEIQARIDCRAILYKAVECNFLDYREPDPKLLELAAKFPEINLGIVPKEYSKEAIDRWSPLITYLSREIGLKISLKVANDYQALLESQKAGLIHMAIYSPLFFAKARLAGSKIEAFAVETNPDGGRGAHSVVYAMSRGPNPKVEDLKGRSIGLVDPNSLTGYSVARFALASQKLDPDSFLGKQVFTGSHENALVALSQGLVDLAVGEWKSDEDSTLTRLLSRGLLKNVDGSPMRRDDFRIVLKSEPLVNSPIAYLADMPEDLKAMLRRAMLEAPMRDRAAFERVYDTKGKTWEIIDTKAYDGTVELLRYMEENRKRKQS